MPDTIIQALREFISQCPYLDILAGAIQIDWLDESPTDYGIFPAGEALLKEDMAGNKTWQYDAAIMMSEYAMENLNRLANCGFMENFHRWINGFSRTGFPLPEGCDFVSIKGGNGIMDNVSEDGTVGRYRIMVNLVYERMM